MSVTLEDLLKLESSVQADVVSKLKGPELLELKEEITEMSGQLLYEHWQNIPIQAQRHAILEALDRMKLAIDKKFASQEQRFAAIVEDVNTGRMPNERLHELLYETLIGQEDTDDFGDKLESPYTTFQSFLNFTHYKVANRDDLIERFRKHVGKEVFHLCVSITSAGMYPKELKEKSIDEGNEFYLDRSKGGSVAEIYNAITLDKLPLVMLDKEKGYVRALDNLAKLTKNPNLIEELIEYTKNEPRGLNNIHLVWMYLSRSNLPAEYVNREVLKLKGVSITIKDLASLSKEELECLSRNKPEEILGKCIAANYPNLFSLYVNKVGVNKEQLNTNFGVQKITPLHFAARHGFKTIVKRFLDEGANVDAKDFYNQTALHCALNNKRRGVAKLLINRGVNVNSQDTLLVTPLHICAEKGDIELIDLLISKAVNKTVARDHEGKTPLHYAAMHGNAVAVVRLLASGSDVNAVDLFTCSPLHYAARCGDLITVDALVKRGAAVDAKDNSGNTPLHLAVCGILRAKKLDECNIQEAKEDVVLYLLKQGVDINTENTYRETPLKIVMGQGGARFIKIFVNAGAKFNSKDIDCATCIQCHQAKEAIKDLERKWAELAKKDERFIPKKRDINGILCEECKEIRELMERKLEKPKAETWLKRVESPRDAKETSVITTDLN